MASRDLHKIPLISILGFLTLGLVSFCLAATVLLLSPDSLTGNPVRGPVLALTHLITLGWIASLVFAAAYLLGPLLAGSPLWSRRLPAFHLLAHLIGVGTLIGGLALARYDVAGVGAVVVFLGLLAFTGNINLTGLTQSRWTPANLSFQSSMFWLTITGGLALLMVRGRITGQMILPSESMIALHAHYALFGFLVQALMGVSLYLVPLVLKADPMERAGSFSAWSGWILLNAGLLLLFPAGESLSPKVHSPGLPHRPQCSFVCCSVGSIWRWANWSITSIACVQAPCSSLPVSAGLSLPLPQPSSAS